VGKTPFDTLASQSSEPFPFRTGHAASIADHCPLKFRWLVGPNAIVFQPRLGNVGPQAEVCGQFQRGVGVITFVGRHLFDLDFAACGFQVDFGFDHAVDEHMLITVSENIRFGRI
jgi:hypothetical protein